jgi:hypothetical protein
MSSTRFLGADFLSRIASLRVNTWVSILAVAASAGWLAATRHQPPEPGPPESISTSKRTPDEARSRPTQ